MYLIPRLIGLFVYVITLGIFYLIICKIDKKDLGKVLFLYTIVLSIIAYNFVPAVGNDLYRLLIAMHSYTQESISQIITTLKTSSTPITVLYFYIIGKFSKDGLLAAVTAFIFYNNVFYIFKKTAIKYSISSKNIALALLFFMSTGSYMEVISGIRTMLGISIVAVCFYKEEIEQKSIVLNIVWYIVAALIHPVALATVIIRFLLLIYQSLKIKNMISFFILFILCTGIFILGKNYINLMSEKAINYVTTENRHWYLWEFLIGCIDMFIIFIIQIKFLKNKNYTTHDSKMIRYFSFIKVINIIILISSIIEYNTFHRFAIFSSILINPILMILLNSKNENKKIYNIVFLSSIIMLFIACSRGNLCSLKFFE
ncbi:EpsG family protein [Romboutsia timonensis]|uniref:EpsG family protein n=1 Tax=Romboutsia timonensis TaxID=1776391 RepID=UPI0039920999